METDKLKIDFGRQTYPDDVQAVFGARLIWPNDLLHDRQDLASRNDDSKKELIAWLNGPGYGNGALQKALDTLRNPSALGMYHDTPYEEEFTIYEDEQGKVIGSPQGSFGYVYICAWLHKHTEQ